VLKKLDVVVFVGVPDRASMTAKRCAIRFHITCVITGLEPVIQLESRICFEKAGLPDRVRQ
jgi:hypothetical protein